MSAAAQTLPCPRPPAPPAEAVRGAKRIGVAVVLVFFLGFGGWSWQAPLSSAAIAPGVVSPEGHRRTVQHLEGGIIKDIHVQDGARVAAGQALLALQDVAIRPRQEGLLAEQLALRAAETRLLAEQQKRDVLTFPADLLAAAGAGGKIAELLELQRALFASRRAARDGQTGILRQRIAGLNEEIAGFTAQVKSTSTQIQLIEEEIGAVSQLVDKGLERKTRLLALERARADIEGDRAESRARIARARQAIGEAEIQIITVAERERDQIGTELAETRKRLTAIEPEILAATDALSRTIVRAPISGTVVELRFSTPEGVVGAGQPILDIIPDEAELLIDARVSPLDIDDVHEGLRAQVILQAYRQRNLPRFYGQVRYVSADSIVDKASGASHFIARVAVVAADLRDGTEILKLTPGMPAEVVIETGEQSVLDYLLQPFIDSIRRSFRER